jgi:hypothetical protein
VLLNLPGVLSQLANDVQELHEDVRSIALRHSLHPTHGT